MRLTFVTLAVALAATLAGPARAAGTVEVGFLPYDRYADAGLDPTDARNNETALSAYLQQLGTRWLPDGQTLKIDVLELDLAGYRRDTSRGNRRISRDLADSPRMIVHYVLSEGSTVLASGEERLTDMGYLYHWTDANPSENLRAEKRMLDKWFKARFVDRKPAG